MRQKLGAKKLAKYRVLTGLPVVHGWVRGGTGHRIDLGLPGGRIVSIYPDGTVEDYPLAWNDKAETERTAILLARADACLSS